MLYTAIKALLSGVIIVSEIAKRYPVIGGAVSKMRATARRRRS